jgi:hypothetical protein
MRFIVCVSRQGFGDFSTDDLTLGRLYEVLDGPDKKGMVRVVDDSGEDFLYPAGLFEAVDVPAETAKRLHDLVVS